MEETHREIIIQGNNDSQEEEKHLKQQLEEKYGQEEILWRQKSRVQWLKEGERNARFFHRSMIHKRHVN